MRERINNVHPSEVLLEEFLKPLNISQNKIAKDTGVHPKRINEICLHKRALSVDTAIRLERYFNIEPEFWLNLQNMYDMEEIQKNRTDAYLYVKPYVAPARAS